METIKQTPGKGRKRMRNPGNWKQNVRKTQRHSTPGEPFAPRCNHNTKSFQCQNLTRRDITHFQATFYNIPVKITQDYFILKYTSASYPARARSRQEQARQDPKKGVTIKYFVKRAVLQPSTDGAARKTVVPVCRQTFLNILRISKDRVQRVCKRHLETGMSPIETRGGNRYEKQFENKKQSMKDFIGNLKPLESHYCRDKVVARQYVSSDLNVNKIWRHYNSSVDPRLQVKKSYFRKFFNTNYNIGFGTPSTDACSFCIMLKEKIHRSKTECEKNAAITESRIHKLRADAFYSIIKEPKEDIIMFSYDCQKNLTLPKVPDQPAYYSRQFYYYNFTMCQGHSKAPQTTRNVFLYVWKETDTAKGSNEIASAVYHRLCNTDIPDQVSQIRLVSDGCGGQNKNTNMVAMVCYWLSHDAPSHVKQVCLLFPVVGHSYIPPDRVFGRIEKILRKKDTIVCPDDYVNIFEEHGTVIHHGRDTKIFDWKISASTSFKNVSTWHFRFNASKRIYIRKKSNGNIEICGEQNYRTDFGEYKGVFKRGKTALSMPRSESELRANVKEAKFVDVDKLLRKHFGENWKTMTDLSYYKNAIDINNERRQAGINNDDVDEESLCEIVQEDEPTV